MSLTRQEIAAGLRELGVRPGMVLMVHSSLSALGHVDGGARTVIEALIEVLGPDGTLMMPAMAADPVFDVNTSPSSVGTVTEAFRHYPNVVRSIHPSHSTCGLGPLAEKLQAGHLEQDSAIGPDSPWGRLARLDNGYVLFLGCDQDRNTLLHTAEDICNLPFLNTIQRDYLDAAGQRRSKTLHRFPGPHRDFIGLEPLFQAAGAVQTGTIGRAACRLMKASQILELAVTALRQDPAAILCDNPHCIDCMTQRAAIKTHRLGQETFRLSAVLDGADVDRAPEQILWELATEGVGAVEITESALATLRTRGPQAVADFVNELERGPLRTAVWPLALHWRRTAPQEAHALMARCLEELPGLAPEFLKVSPFLVQDSERAATAPMAADMLQALAAAAQEHNTAVLIENHPAGLWRTEEECSTVLGHAAHPCLGFSFNPAHFAQVGEKPFLRTWTRGKLKRHTRQLMVSDGCGRPGWPAYTAPGQGQGEVKELISILRCRGFNGLLTVAPLPGAGGSLRAQLGAFWRLMEAL